MSFTKKLVKNDSVRKSFFNTYSRKGTAHDGFHPGLTRKGTGENVDSMDNLRNEHYL
jgi:hypothetical protein